jgi:beta-mannosidase
MVQSKLCLAALAFFSTVSAQAILDLGDETWTVTNEYDNITVPGKWPSQVHLDLYAAGIIGEFTDNSQ